MSRRSYNVPEAGPHVRDRVAFRRRGGGGTRTHRPEGLLGQTRLFRPPHFRLCYTPEAVSSRRMPTFLPRCKPAGGGAP